MIRSINGKDYNFKMTRKGLRAAETAGMDMAELASKPMLALSYLWFAELYAAHPMKFDKACDLLDDFLDNDPSEDFSSLLEEFTNDYTLVFGLAAE